jgi:glycosyltransferase involved in cell wall biosynthesis
VRLPEGFKLNIAFSHDWLNGMRGGEKCLEAFCELYPHGDIFTLFYEKGKVSEILSNRRITVSYLQRFPKIFTHYRHYLPLFPGGVESFDLKNYDLVISTSHCVAKGAVKKKSAFHLCYCFTPMRYAWGFFEEYFGDKKPPTKKIISFFLNQLKVWDLKSNQNIDHFVAISHHVRKRIEDFYQRAADVIYPPVDTDFYTPDPAIKREDFYLIVSALVPYKKIELAIDAFNRLGKPLVIIGDGPQRKKLETLAQKNVTFLGWQSNEILREYYRKARALVFPGEEDFGIVPVEVQACGGGVIAYAKGGALETVIEGKTGEFFGQTNAESLEEAIRRFEKKHFDGSDSRQNALRFGRQRFKQEMKEKIRALLAAQWGACA